MKGEALREQPCSWPSCLSFLPRPQGPLLTGTEPGEVVAHMDSRSPMLGYPGAVQLFKNIKIKVTILYWSLKKKKKKKKKLRLLFLKSIG